MLILNFFFFYIKVRHLRYTSLIGHLYLYRLLCIKPINGLVIYHLFILTYRLCISKISLYSYS